MTPAQAAVELGMIARSILALGSDIERGILQGHDGWTIEYARHVVERIANAEVLLNDVKREVDDEKRTLMGARESK